ncbi:hypothetical protein AVM02_00245 [Brucella anthropi]
MRAGHILLARNRASSLVAWACPVGMAGTADFKTVHIRTPFEFCSLYRAEKQKGRENPTFQSPQTINASTSVVKDRGQ